MPFVDEIIDMNQDVSHKTTQNYTKRTFRISNLSLWILFLCVDWSNHILAILMINQHISKPHFRNGDVKSAYFRPFLHIKAF